MLEVEDDLVKTLSTIRWIRNTFVPINKLHPELLASIPTFAKDPFGPNGSRVGLPSLCAAVCRHWRNSLFAFPGVWSRIDSSNSHHTNFYLARSKQAPLHVSFGRSTSPDVFKRRIIPERHRLRSFFIPLGRGNEPNLKVTQSLVEPAESLRTLHVWTVSNPFAIQTATMETISRFAPNITVLELRDIFTALSSLHFPSLVKLVFRITAPYISAQKLDATDLIQFLKHSPILEDLDLYLPKGFKAVRPVAVASLQNLKYAVFNGSSTLTGPIAVEVLPYLKLPEKSLTVHVQTRSRAFTSCTSPLLSVIQLGHSIFPQQSITAAAVHIKHDPHGFYGHIGICGEYNNWIGLNHVRLFNFGKDPLSRLRDWLDPKNLGPLRGIKALTLGLFEFSLDEEQCMQVLQTFLRPLDQVCVLNVYKMNLSMIARILQPSDGTLPFPSLEKLNLHSYDPPELTRCAEHDEGKCDVIASKREFSRCRSCASSGRLQEHRHPTGPTGELDNQ